MNLDGKDQRQITTFGSMSWSPYQHPSGEYFIFSSNKLGFENFEVFLVDKAGLKIAGTRNDSMMLCLQRVLKQATPVPLENNSDLLIKALELSLTKREQGPKRKHGNIPL